MLRILIAYDGSACSQMALHDLRRAGLPQELQAKILTVSDVRIPLENSEAAKKANPHLPYLPPDYAFAYEKALEAGKSAAQEACRLANQTEKL